MRTKPTASSRRTHAQWKQSVEQSETTALSLRAFCDEIGVHLQSLYYRAYLTDIISKLQAGYPLREINRLRPDIWASERSTLVAHQLAE